MDILVAIHSHSRCLRTQWNAIKLFVLAWNRRQMHKRRYSSYPAYAEDFMCA